ncbi:MAG: TRAP transporter small permease [Acetobacteraceae bacterium]|jgi:TRAP-type C4-dicarboxylate transport system permease small subunit|nr:TRAP transporter small permease [Acetobacteraceae bacterium]
MPADSAPPAPREEPATTVRGPYGRFTATLARVLCVLVALTVGILVIPVSLQIFSRYTAFIPHYIWTEEMARFLLVWMIMLGAMLGVREGSHFVVDVWPVLKPRRQAALDLVANLFMLGFAFVLLWWGWEFTDFAWFRISELAELPLWLIHIAWPICGVVWMLFLGERIVANLRTILSKAA